MSHHNPAQPSLNNPKSDMAPFVWFVVPNLPALTPQGRSGMSTNHTNHTNWSVALLTAPPYPFRNKRDGDETWT